jgi:hypothetical protein
MRTELNPSRRYRNDILSWRAAEICRNVQDVVRLVVLRTRRPINAETVKRVFNGDNAGFDTVWAVADGLNINRHSLTDFDLKERQFRQAVVTNGKRG